MGVSCPRCRSRSTSAISPGLMMCNSCSHSWRPYKHRGKKMKTVGDGIIYPRKRVMPGARTRSIGDGIIFPKKRIKKVKARRSIFGF